MTEVIEQQFNSEKTKLEENIKQQTGKKLVEHKSTTVKRIKDKIINFATKTIKQLWDKIAGKSLDQKLKKAQEVNEVVNKDALNKINEYIYKKEENKELATMFSNIFNVYYNEDGTEEESKEELMISYFLSLRPEQAKQEIESYMLISSTIKSIATDSEAEAEAETKQSNNNTQEIYGKILAISKNFKKELDSRNNNWSQREPCSEQTEYQSRHKEEFIAPEKSQQVQSASEISEETSKNYERLKNKKVIDPATMESKADKYEYRKWSTWCSETAQDNAREIFHRKLINGNAHIAICRRPLSGYVKTIQLNKIPKLTKEKVTLPEYWKTEKRDSLKDLPRPTKDNPGTIIDLWVLSSSKHWHRTLWYFDFSKGENGERMVLDPYRSHIRWDKKRSRKPVTLNKYIDSHNYKANRNVFCARFYTSDYIVWEPS